MKKIGQIMSDMGFNKNASDDVKIAFLKYLFKSANEQEFKQSNGLSIDEKIKVEASKQLEFDFSTENIEIIQNNKIKAG